ncbi:DUF2975 domain-containing protein [Virgibacillus sp. C22-A2]|uniref:DUF2975 domain-containing protein n=1 Tax=Virgibacillus tibetensis TaxID=3042313 RepID=A0ABU6KJ40_9BACI|nr:DUF2975 domain-containing protein [Virgibacillus sp. C22-A2]
MNIASNILKILLVMFAIGVIFIGVYVLPTMAEEMRALYPELEYAKLPILITCELLLALLLIGIGFIMYLLIVFDRGLTFSSRFIRGVEILVGMCIIASIGIIILFQYMRTFGGPGPLLSLIMIGVTFIIWIVAAVIMLIRAIVNKAIIYKDDYDLTV